MYIKLLCIAPQSSPSDSSTWSEVVIPLLLILSDALVEAQSTNSSNFSFPPFTPQNVLKLLLDGDTAYNQTNSSFDLNARIKIGFAGYSCSRLVYNDAEWMVDKASGTVASFNTSFTFSFTSMLDVEFNAYLGDFGLARMVDHRKLEKTTLLAGTLGYMAPDMQYTGRATKESYVYAFGILMLEIMCGKPPLDLDAVNPREFVLLDFVWHAHETENLASMADPRLSAKSPGEDRSEGTKTVMQILQLGLLCCLPHPSERPSMRMVNQWLRASENSGLMLPSLLATKPFYAYRTFHFVLPTVDSIVAGARCERARQFSRVPVLRQRLHHCRRA